eukprot:47108-Pyramimonas_sp.AAC.1
MAAKLPQSHRPCSLPTPGSKSSKAKEARTVSMAEARQRAHQEALDLFGDALEKPGEVGSQDGG